MRRWDLDNKKKGFREEYRKDKTARCHLGCTTRGDVFPVKTKVTSRAELSEEDNFQKRAPNLLARGRKVLVKTEVFNPVFLPPNSSCRPDYQWKLVSTDVYRLIWCQIRRS